MDYSTQDFVEAHLDLLRRSTFVRIIEFFRSKVSLVINYIFNAINSINQPITGNCPVAPEISSIFLVQNDNWDCGIACCGMILNWANLDRSLLYADSIATSKKPLWTIDLFLFLNQYSSSLHTELYTLSFGVQSHHEQFEWYQQHLLDDMVRVNAKTKLAFDEQLPMYKRRVTLFELQRRLHDETVCIAIVLVDSLTLQQGRRRNRYGYSDAYTGHYLVLIRYDSQEDCFYYFNPALDTGLQKIDSAQLDFARHHPATDEDLLFCTKKSSWLQSEEGEEGEASLLEVLNKKFC